MAGAIPASFNFVPCPRCSNTVRLMVNISQGGVVYRCAGCEWQFTASTQAPTAVSNALVAVGAVAIPLAAGGASFTIGMSLLYDTGTSAEILRVTATGSATSIPVSAFGKAHATATAFGQLLLTPVLQTIERVPPAPSWGF
jgi:hypothetical protein